MLMQEFTDMTGFEPTPEEYQEIEKMYLKFDGSKKAFCQDFVERGEVEDLLETLGDLNEDQKKDMLVFFQGVALGRMLAERQAV